jgi:hypothetical protein
MDVSDVTDVSEVPAVSIFRVEICMIGEFICMESRFEKQLGAGDWCLVWADRDSAQDKLRSR